MTRIDELKRALLSAIRQYHPGVRRRRQEPAGDLFGACQTRLSNSSDKSCRWLASGRRIRQGESG